MATASVIRNSLGMRINQNGLLEEISANLPRYQYDPVSKTCKGILVEGLKTNLSYPYDMSVHLIATKNNLTISSIPLEERPNTLAVTTKVGYKIVESNTPNGVQHFYTKRASISIQNNTLYSISLLAKYSGRHLQLKFRSGVFEHGFSREAWANFDLLNGTVGAVGSAAINPTIVSLGNDVFLCTVSAMSTLNSTTEQLVCTLLQSPMDNDDIYGSASYVGDGVSGVIVQCHQLEEGPPSSPILAVSGQSSSIRQPDVVAVTGTDFSNWFNPSEGTFIIEFENRSDLVPIAPIFALNQGNTDNNNHLVMQIEDGYFKVTLKSSSESWITYTSQILMPSTQGTRKAYLSYSKDDIVYGVDTNSIYEAHGFTDLVMAMDRMFIGSDGLISAPNYFNGVIGKVKYIPRFMSQSAINNL